MTGSCVWIERLTFMLTLLSVKEVTLALYLLFAMPFLLNFTGGHVTTAAGLVASLVSLPSAIKLRSLNHFKNRKEAELHYRKYQWCLIVLSSVTHLIAAVLSLAGAINADSLSWSLVASISEYQSSQNGKIFMDLIQWKLQCCGAYSYKDWFAVDWRGRAVHMGHTGRKSIRTRWKSGMLISNSNYPKVRWDTVPYSCCNTRTMEPCIHENLRQLGTGSINVKGCKDKLYLSVVLFFMIEFTFYITVALLTLAIVYLMSIEVTQDSCNCYRDENSSSASRRDLWTAFYNSFNPSTDRTYDQSYDAAQLHPTSHTEVTLDQQNKN